MSKIKNVPPQISDGDTFIEDSCNRESTAVTKAPIDVFKTILIFVFPALGGLLFGEPSPSTPSLVACTCLLAVRIIFVIRQGVPGQSWFIR